MGQRSADVDRPVREVDGLAEHVQHAAERGRRRRASVIGAPRSTAFMPRCRPSVGFIATARTRLSPRCCSTSATTSIFSSRRRRDAQGVVDRRQVPALELDVHDGADDLDDLADFGFGCYCHVLCAFKSSIRLRQLPLPARDVDRTRCSAATAS